MCACKDPGACAGKWARIANTESSITPPGPAVRPTLLPSKFAPVTASPQSPDDVRAHPGYPPMGRFLTVANLLSLSRAVLVAPITWLVWHGGPVGPLSALVALAIATDFFDGRVARWSRTVSEWGKVLDAIADKLAAASVCLALLLRPESSGPRLPLWFVALVLVRDLALTIGGLVQTKRVGRFTTSLWSGKVAVTLLAGTVLAALLSLPPRIIEAGVWGTAAVMLVSLVEYAHRFRLVWRLGPGAPLDAEGHLVESGRPGGSAIE